METAITTMTFSMDSDYLVTGSSEGKIIVNKNNRFIIFNRFGILKMEVFIKNLIKLMMVELMLFYLIKIIHI